ncbi:unnamed protein product [Ectocarpus sp. 4 AP-2014]|uniref:EsV-1-177 n=1 Tax=Ectocarpus siliculosus virus 1 (isolate New Zealand/Kaikoura/1988) TaxID=654926 RepID=Q8QNB0_ESV1K|nr:EsV-1-177 [Ectocarpus siliculosus virus 1]AAK14591.1 EsV-1-177 [Ectocarpus siliculosus virus 1]
MFVMFFGSKVLLFDQKKTSPSKTILWFSTGLFPRGNSCEYVIHHHIPKKYFYPILFFPIFVGAHLDL